MYVESRSFSWELLRRQMTVTRVQTEVSISNHTSKDIGRLWPRTIIDGGEVRTRGIRLLATDGAAVAPRCIDYCCAAAPITTAPVPCGSKLKSALLPFVVMSFVVTDVAVNTP